MSMSRQVSDNGNSFPGVSNIVECMVEFDIYIRKCDLLSNNINLRNRRDTEPYVRWCERLRG